MPDETHLASQRADLLRFASGSRHPLGFGWLDEAGHLVTGRPVELWITCRMTHVMCLGFLADEPPAPSGPTRRDLFSLATHGVNALSTSLLDEEYDGWFAAVDATGPITDSKQAYGHAFVLLAAASAVVAGIDRSQALLERAMTVHDRRFWEADSGLVVDEWDRRWTELAAYRGINANMHMVESYLAVGDVTGERMWHRRAGRIARRVVEWARCNDWRIPEHFDTEWQPALDHNRDVPAHPFQPYGATIGHGLEWARLLIAVDASLGSEAPPGLVDAAKALNARAIADGWAVDGECGFVYTTDWQGVPVVHTRMHWVVAEAANTAEVLHRVTGESNYQDDVRRWWDYADRFLIDHGKGSWHHELDRHNKPSATVWPGKPDVYHAYQAALLPALPIAPCFASALAERALT